MTRSSIRCQRCGWWDLAMRFGEQRECSRCGAPVLTPFPTEGAEPANTTELRTVQALPVQRSAEGA